MLSQVEARATKLHEVLGEWGCQLNHSDCLNVMSKIDRRPDGKLHTEDGSGEIKLAEQYLDELLEGVAELSYVKFTRRFEEKYLVLFTEREFQQEIPDTFNEFGSYVRRDFLGCIGGLDRPGDDRYPNEVRYLWRGFFEKNEALLLVGIYQKHGTHYISGARSV